MLIRSIVLFTVLATGCRSANASREELAPTASALAPAERPAAQAQALAIEPKGAAVRFTLDAPVEKIHGEVLDATSGELFVDPKDVTKTTGLIKVDLFALELFQQRREDDKQEFGERTKNADQNRHAKSWLEISDDAPPAAREANRWVEYRIDKVLDASATDLTKLPGPERKLTATVEGDFRLHQRKTRKRAKVEATFELSGEKITGVTLRTLEPMQVGLEEHDVVPRELFGKLAKKTLSDLGQKVGKEAPITLSITAKAR